MSDSLGLSIGATNLVATRTGRPSVVRRSVLTLFEHRAPEVGLPSENPSLTEPGMVMWGFVERVGDPVPLVAQDGSSHRGDALTVEALDAMARTVAGGAAPERIAIAVPAHWSPATLGALRGALRSKTSLFSDGAPPELVPDAAAALAALKAGQGLPDSGVVALCDFGGSGTTLALADAGAGLSPIGEVVRYADLSGEQIDQAVLRHVLADLSDAGGTETAGTAAVGALTRLRSECKLAKERLSAETATVIPVQLPTATSDVRLTRSELEALMAEPLAGFFDALGDLLENNRIPAASLTAVATVGGGAAIPLVTQRLSEELRVPVITSPDPSATVAAGAGLLAAQGPSPDAPTGLATSVDAADLPTGLAPAAWVAGAAGAAAAQSASDGSPSATFRALAWSDDDSPGSEPVPYSGEDYTFDTYAQQGGTSARPAVEFDHGDDETYVMEPPPLPWYKRPPVLFGAAAAAALLAVGGLAITLTGTSSDSGPVTETSTLPTESGAPSPEVPLTTETVIITGENGQVTTSMVPPPPPPPSTTTTAPTTTTTSPTTTTATTTTTTPTTTTTTRTTTTQPTTTQQTTTQQTTTPPPTTTFEPPPTTPDEPVIPDVPDDPVVPTFPDAG
jgi:hypothetical protein